MEQERVEGESGHVEHDLGLHHFPHQEVLARHTHRLDLEDQAGDVEPRGLGDLVEGEFEFLAGHDDALSVVALELIRVTERVCSGSYSHSNSCSSLVGLST